MTDERDDIQSEHDEPADGEALSPKQEEAISALLEHPTQARAAQAVGISEKTLRRWLDRPAFAAAYRRARREAFGQALGLVQRCAPMAVNALAKIVTDPAAPVPSRVAAASALLRFGREALELDDLAVRVEALE